MPKVIELAVPTDFSVGAINRMLEVGRNNLLGACTGCFYNEVTKDRIFDWGLVFEHGDMVVSRA